MAGLEAIAAALLLAGSADRTDSVPTPVRDPGGTLETFRQDLRDLRDGRRAAVTVVQIGDSHIQADFLSGRVRERLQALFGGASCGLVFPHALARSNSPVWLRAEPSGSWNARSALSRSLRGAGLSGFLAESADSTAALDLRWRRGATWTKGLLLRERDSLACPLEWAGDDTTSWSFLPGGAGPRPDTLAFPAPQTALRIRVRPERDGEGALRPCRLGFSALVPTPPGLRWLQAGANGARHTHWNRVDSLLPDLALIRPDLVVVSLGTNEAFQAGLTDSVAISEFVRLWDRIDSAVPGVPILVTGPPDASRRIRRRRYVPHEGVARMAALLDSATAERGIAWWDLRRAMGGAGAMERWYARGLAASDRVHYSAAGYRLQADLLVEALLDGLDEPLPGNRP